LGEEILELHCEKIANSQLMEKKEEEVEDSNPFQPAECLEEDTEGFFN
jgi:hypothetical protein